MPLQPGTSLGPYQIDAPLGAGGMGEVYKATDTRLDRTVAIKVLPEHVASDPDLKQRFEREARTVAALNHPHICTLHDIGTQDGIDFLVMEYLDGQTLAQRLEKGALPLDQALTIAIEIADALDKAHRQGIVHRDLKPANIMLTKAGAKLLDFGLAKPTGMARGTDSAMPTMSAALTAEGSILGTLQYMAPEQLEGDDVGARTDIFAFGATVYEMVTGETAFAGKSQASLIGSILKDDPRPISALQPVSPAALDRVVKKCLAKDSEARWHSAHDLHDELQWVKDEGASSGVPVSSPPKSQGRLVAVAVALVAGLGLVTVLGTTWFAEPTPQRPVRIPIDLPAGTELDRDSFAVSPDGQLVVYAGEQDGERQLYRRAFGELDAQAIPGTATGQAPTFSPDGQSIAFSTGFLGGDRALEYVPLAGGQATTIVDGVTAESVSWKTDDSLVFALPTVGTTLQQAQLSGGTAHEITRQATDAGENDHKWPDVLPGGRHLLFEVNYVTGRESDIVVQSIDANDRRVLIEGMQPRYVPTGHIVFRRGNALWAVPFDVDGLEIVGAPVSIADGVSSFSVSDSGTLVYAPERQTSGRSVVWVDEDGVEERLDLEPDAYGSPALSPDGGQLAMTVRTGNRDIWIYDLERGQLRRATFDPGLDAYPLWTRDGQRIAFSSARDGIRNLFWRAADGTGEVERLTESENIQSPWTWSPDGQTLIFQQEIDANWGIYAHAMDAGESEPLIQSPGLDGAAQVSTDGRWMAFMSSGAVWVQPFPNLNDGRWQITDDGNLPKWSPDGQKLYFRRSRPPMMMAVSITSGSPVEWETPQPLFAFDYYLTPGSPSYDVSPQDGRFLMIKEAEATVEDSLTPDLVVVLHWFDELQRLVPTP